MRVKTEGRRNAIVEAATEVFREVGYERASMAMISARIGGSKGTLYGYFKSKEELFAIAMTEVLVAQGEELSALLDPSAEDVRLVLTRFGHGYLRLLTSPDALSILRIVLAQGSNSELGAQLYERGPRRGWQPVVAYISRLQAKGAIRAVDPRVAAEHLRGLLEAGFIIPMLFGAPPEFEPNAAVVAAVEAFLRTYAVPGSDAAKRV